MLKKYKYKRYIREPFMALIVTITKKCTYRVKANRLFKFEILITSTNFTV